MKHFDLILSRILKKYILVHIILILIKKHFDHFQSHGKVREKEMKRKKIDLNDLVPVLSGKFF